MYKAEGESQAIILVKAAPQISQKHGKIVCCAGVTPEGEWVRLYPVTFRKLEDMQQFGRWDRIKFKWRVSSEDSRPESRRIDQNSIEIIGQLSGRERHKFLSRLEVTGLNNLSEQGRSLALLRPRDPKFYIKKKSDEKIAKEKHAYENVVSQKDILDPRDFPPIQPSPYEFKYKYACDDGERNGTCQDWEIHATYFNWTRSYGEESALTRIQNVFGEEYPKKGMAFAMGTHSQYPNTWLINAVIRMDEISQLSLL